MRDIKSKLTAKLREGDTRERCGFVTARGRVVEVPNVADDPTQQFKIDPRQVLDWVAKGAVATWHTHPSTTPNLSGEDYNCFLNWDEMRHYIIGRHDGTTRVKEYAVEDGLVVVL